MTRRIFVSAAHTGLTAVTTRVTGGRATFRPQAEFTQERSPDDGGAAVHQLGGPEFAVVGPGDVVGFDQGAVLRCTPAPGSVDAVDNYLATIDLTDARLPWLLNLPSMGDRPWLTLVVLRDDEGDLIPGNPLPLVSAPASALPDPADLASWAHVEARIEDGEDLSTVLEEECRTGTDRVVARLICPRKLDEHKGWLACVVPTTLAGKAAGEGRRPTENEGGQPAWRAGGGATLPVYYSWRFRTGPSGSFEELARLVKPMDASDITGLGSRTIDVRHPWRHADLLGGAPAEVTLDIQGALRVPGEAVANEAWSDGGAQTTFTGMLTPLLNAPGRLAEDRDEGALAPPLYGSHHTGHRAVPGSGWVQELNLEVRHRIAASLGARYVQLEQEFLMERAWEQVGEVREANRRMAAAELAAEAATVAQAKHLDDMNPQPLTLLAAPITDQVRMGEAQSLDSMLAGSQVPDGTATASFRRLSRSKGALGRRAQRSAVAAEMGMPAPSVISEGLGGAAIVPMQPVTWVTAGASVAEPMVAVDTSSTYGTGTMVGLLDAQRTLFGGRTEFAVGDPAEALAVASAGVGGGMGSSTTSTIAAVTLRGLRRAVVNQPLIELSEVEMGSMGMDTVVNEIRASLDAMPQQLELISRHVVTDQMAGRAPAQTRPLRQIMAHPRFGFPVAAELLTRWPEWTIPGITEFPENTCTLLEMNAEFVEACLVGLNQEFNRELLWREYPTDQAGTPFARFWPGEVEPFGEIGLWGDGGDLGSHDKTGGAAHVTLLVRADVLRRFPGTILLAVPADATKRVPETGGAWQQPIFTLPVDDRTCVFGFPLTGRKVLDESWLFVLREPMRGTQFGFDLTTPQSPAFETWADMRWEHVPQKRSFAHANGTLQQNPSSLTATDPRWSPSAVDIASIAFQRPFQMAYSPKRLLGEDFTG